MKITVNGKGIADVQIVFFGLVFIVLLILKLTGAAVIPWLVVFSPLIISSVIVMFIILIAVIAAVAKHY